MGRPQQFPLKAINESGTVTTDVQILQVPDAAITAQSGVVSIASSTGDVTGPSSSTDNAIARFDSTTGKLIQNSAGFVSDAGIIYGVNVAGGQSTTAVAAVGMTLTVASAGTQVFTATSGGTDVLMPVVTTLPQVGTAYHFINKSNGNISITSSGANAITTIVAGQSALVVCILLTGTTAASWTVVQTPGFDVNGVPYAANFTSGLSSTVTAAGTTTLTVASNRIQMFTGSSTQTVTLPVVSTLPQVGYSFEIINDSDTGAVTVNSSGGNLVQTVPIGARVIVSANALTGTSAEIWNKMFFSPTSNAGAVTLTSPTLVTPLLGTPVSGNLLACTGNVKNVTADVTNATATMADITDLSFTLTAAGVYSGEMIVKCADSTAAEGISIDFDGGAATMTAFAAGAGLQTGGTTVAVTTVSSALATDLNWTTITGETWITIQIGLTVNAGGTFIPRFCQGTAHTSGTATVYRGSSLRMWRVS